MRLDTAGPSRLARLVLPATRGSVGMRACAGARAAVAARGVRELSTTTRTPAAPATAPPMHPAFGGLAGQLGSTQPCFGARGENIEILPSPTVFHERLLDMVKRARRRILISTLYIGTEEASLVDAIETALATRPGLRATFVLDYNRATRPGSGTPASTVHMLTPLLEKYGDRVDVLLYRSPKLRGLLEKIVPPRFNEGWGTWHAKYYAVDDDVVLSGANLAASYFTNRQDRYMYIGAHAPLLSYLSSLTRLVSEYTYRVVPHARAGLGAHGVSLGGSTGGSDAAALWRESSLDPRGFQTHAQARLNAFQQAWRASNAVRTRDAVQGGADTFFWPVIQAGVLGLHEEDRGMRLLWDAIAQAPKAHNVDVDLTSGYFGLYSAYKQAVIASPAPVRVIAASPKANGFYGSKGVSRLIPEGYTLLERRFHDAVVRAGREWDGVAGVRIQEWERQGWTYHAKGMWVSPRGEAPVLTFIGSSNLSTRSLNLDTELSLLLSTSSEPLRAQLADELVRLREYAHDVGAETWRLPERRVSLAAKVLVALGVEGML